ncbi:MAG TPA: hypothetical protein VGI17_06670 [Solirubrobacterales bacterium]|jgi:hypothetical protein
MFKKLMLVAMALGALVAFAIPAGATAATGELTVEGKLLKPGSSVTAKGNIGGVQTFGSWTCTVTLQGTVIKNTAEGSTSAIKSSSTEGCRYLTLLEYPVTFTNLTGTLGFGSISRLFLSGSETGLPDPFDECDLGEGAFVGVNYTPGSSTFSIAGTVPLEGGHSYCGHATFATQGQFSLTSGSKPVVVH